MSVLSGEAGAETQKRDSGERVGGAADGAPAEHPTGARQTQHEQREVEAWLTARGSLAVFALKSGARCTGVLPLTLERATQMTSPCPRARRCGGAAGFTRCVLGPSPHTAQRAD